MHRTNRRAALALLGLTALAACGGGSAAPMPDGPLNVGVIAGNNQSVTAAPAAPLPLPVVAQVVRLPSGTIALRTRIVDAVLPEKAYAQTAVVGVPGIVVCARTPDPKHALTAEVLCANSDAAGKAYFVFRADTVSGTSRAHVAYSSPTGTKVTDSVSATVATAPARDWNTIDGTSYTFGSARIGDTLRVRDRINAVWDKYNNFIYWKGRGAGAPTAFRVRYRRLNTTPSLNDPALIDGDTFVIRQGDGSFQLAIDTLPARDAQVKIVP
jgi:hypothetical protein